VLLFEGEDAKSKVIYDPTASKSAILVEDEFKKRPP
jgi:hypothetical protein